jgi:hypothetical protein
MTDIKVSELKEQFPDADESSLLEILISCDGSISMAEKILLESFPEGPKRKRMKLERQRNIKALFGAKELHSQLRSTNTTGANRPVYLYSKEDLESTVPYATIHYDFLPKDVADSLLTTTVRDTNGFVNSEFFLFGNKCVSNHQTKMYSSKPIEGIFYNGVEVKAKDVFTDDHSITQLLIEDQVNKEINEREKLPFEDKGLWKGDFALCNKFHSKANDLDWHSDRLTYIGPHCTIASLSLGATREFRIRKQYHPKKASSKFNSIYSIPLPHNTLLIMHAGFQEEFKHCIPSTTELKAHPLSGTMRVNFTYRNYLSGYKDKMPKCDRCGSSMELRRCFKDPHTRGRYFWLCAGSYKNRDCSGMYWGKFDCDDLVTSDIEKSSLWIAPDDHEALECFRESIREKLKEKSSE